MVGIVQITGPVQIAWDSIAPMTCGSTWSTTALQKKVKQQLTPSTVSEMYNSWYMGLSGKALQYWIIKQNKIQVKTNSPSLYWPPLRAWIGLWRTALSNAQWAIDVYSTSKRCQTPMSKWHQKLFLAARDLKTYPGGNQLDFQKRSMAQMWRSDDVAEATGTQIEPILDPKWNQFE